MGKQWPTEGVTREREEGQTNVEYALILIIVSISSAVVLTIIGNRVADTFLNSVPAAF